MFEDSPNVDTKGPFCASLCETSIDSTSASSMNQLAPLAIVMMSSLIISMLK